MPSHFILWPVLLYIATALLIPRFSRWVDRAGRTLAVLLSSALAFLLILLIVQRVGASTFQWTMSAWEAGTRVGSGVQFRVDALSIPFLLLTGLLGMGVLVGSLDEQPEVSSEDYQAGLLVILAGAVALALVANVMTLLFAGLLLDAGMIFGIGLAGRPRWFLVTVMHSLVAQGITLSALLLLWRDTGASALAGAGPQVLLLLILAAVVRMAPLPLSLFSVPFESLPQRVLGILPLATLGVGSLMLGQLTFGVGASGLPNLSAYAPLAALSIALSGWAAWHREEPSVRLMMLGAVQAGWVAWAFAWGQPTVALTIGFSGVLALAALAVHGGQLDFRHGTQLPGGVAALMLVGVPGSGLWNAMTVLGGEAGMRGANWLLALASVGTMGSTFALIQWLLPERTAPIQRSRWTGVGLLAGLSVPFIGALWGVQVPVIAAAPLALSPLVAQLVIPTVGWAGGLWLWRTRERLHTLRPALDFFSSLFSFAWLWRIIGRAGWLLLTGLRGMMLVLEGENYGWLLLFLFITMIFWLQR